MSATWSAIVAASLACVAFKVLGYLVPQRLFEPEPVRRSTELLPVALLSGLVVTQAFAVGQTLALDARAAALGAAAVLFALRVPFLVVVVVAAVVAALLRALL